MKSFYTISIFFLAAIALWGCPYKSYVGIDATNTIPTDPALLGTWRTSKFPSDSTEIKFFQWNKNTYAVTAKLPDEDIGYDHFIFYAWFSQVNQRQLLTFYDSESKYYYFGEAFPSRNSLTIKMLSSDITKEKFYRVAAMRKFIEDLYSSNSVKYDTDPTFQNLVRAE
jgi:hypothetical protein